MSLTGDGDGSGGGAHSLPHPAEVERGTTSSIRKSGGVVRTKRDTLKTMAGVAGNVLEWYDFSVFGYFSDVIGSVFFPPEQSQNTQIAGSFLVFGLAFVMRPLGGLFTGYVGDTIGRKKALVMSMMLMAFPTFLMGCIPSYERIGWVSIALLSIVRCLQGLSVGGQLVSSLVFTVEGHHKERWGLYGSFVMMSALFGTLLGGLVSYGMREALTYDQLVRWGWRVPFLAGILIMVPGLYLKFHCEEGDIGGHHEEVASCGSGGGANPVKAAFARDNLRALLSAYLVPMIWAVGIKVSFVWMAIFMESLMDPPVPHAFAVNSVALFVGLIIMFPLAGLLSDYCGRVRVMVVGGCGLAVVGPVMVYTISLGDAALACVSQVVLGILLSLWGGPMCAWLVESFPPQHRLTSVAIGYDLAQASVGALTPFVATILVDNVGATSPGILYPSTAILSLVGLCIAPSAYDSGKNAAGASGNIAMMGSRTENLITNDESESEAKQLSTQIT